MTDAAWWSQPVAAEGSTASEGIRRQLGKPRLDPLTVLIRETAQNTCDAGLLNSSQIEYTVRINELSGNQLTAWREFLLPEPLGSDLGISRWFDRGSPTILSIADRGTTGLGGPIRADELARPGERSDFVNFIRNVGERKDMQLGGGSYGFGKGILYNVSRCHVVVADSVCIFRGRLQRRLIAAALGDGYTGDTRRFTGRHWLGLLDGGDIARPLLDDEAAEMARRLGLPKFHEGATGTTVVVVDADLGRKTDSELTRNPEEAARYIASTILWNLWPRMLQNRRSRLVCAVKQSGFEQRIPAPESVPELKSYVDSYLKLESEGAYAVPVRKQSPQDVGRFASTKSMAPSRADSLIDAAAPYEGRAHHCARMRQADLVVDYFPGDTLADEMIQYGGVFRVSRDADTYFAEAEPPTHDDWVLNGLRGTPRGVVQLAGKFIREQLSILAQRQNFTTSGSSVALGSLATRLSGLMGGTAADAATASGPGQGGKGSRSSGRSAAPRFVEGPELIREVSGTVLRAVVQMPEWPTPKIVEVECKIVLDSGFEPPGVDSPKALEWRSTTSKMVVKGGRLRIDRDSDKQWEVRIRPTADAVVRLNLVVSEIGTSQ